ncbi:MAG: DUF1318 domain-containing protein [Campylobacterales bacterium]|nr:DUF1318 domain-containing protein [Campylobacterales bacterium]
MKKIILVLGFLAFVNFVGCSSGCLVITPPDVHMTGEKTVIENQIVGQYKELEKDVWVISSVNSSFGGDSQLGKKSIGNKQLYIAMEVRAYNQKAVRDYKDRLLVGETNDGLLKIMSKKGLDKAEVTKLESIVAEENRSRKEIFSLSLQLSKKRTPTKDELDAFAREFADEQRAMAKSGDWIENKNGSWVKK